MFIPLEVVSCQGFLDSCLWLERKGVLNYMLASFFYSFNFFFEYVLLFDEKLQVEISFLESSFLFDSCNGFRTS